MSEQTIPEGSEPMSTERRWATKHDVAEYIHASVSTVDRMVERGELTAYPVGKRLVRFDLNEVDDALTSAGKDTSRG